MKIDKQFFLQMLAPFGIGAGAIIVGLIWPSFYWLLVGFVVIFFVLFYLAYGLIAQDTYHMSSVPGCWGLAILVLITAISIIFNGTRYISSKGEKQHLYSDCQYLRDCKNVKEVSQFEGFFHLCFSDCNKCHQREIDEDKQYRTNTMIEDLQEEVEELQEDIADYRKRINVLKKEIRDLQNGADIDSYDFEEREETGSEEEYYDEDVDPPFLRYEP